MVMPSVEGPLDPRKGREAFGKAAGTDTGSGVRNVSKARAAKVHCSSTGSEMPTLEAQQDATVLD